MSKANRYIFAGFVVVEVVLLLLTVAEFGRYFAVADASGANLPGSIAEIETVRLGWWVLLLSVGQMLAGLVGIYFVARTLRANEAAVAVANETLASQRKASVDESRAYVHAASAMLERDTAGNPRVQFGFRNTGQTPATFFEFAATFVEVSRGTARQQPFPVFSRGDFKRWSPIGAGDLVTAAWQDDRLRGRLFAHTIRQQSVILFLGAVQYRTIYGELFETQFAYFVSTVPDLNSEAKLSRSTNPAKAYHLIRTDEPALPAEESLGHSIIPREEEDAVQVVVSME